MEITENIDYIVKNCEDMEENGSYDIALLCLRDLTILKFVIGNEKFDDLPAFKRWLNMSDKIVNESINKEIKNEK